MDTQHTIEILNSLLSGELSAIETYSYAIHKYPDSYAIKELQELRMAHLNSTDVLRELVVEYGGNPSTDPGPWGGFARSVEAVAAMMGESTTLSVLKEGEGNGIDEYEEALEDYELDREIKTAIRDELLPPLRDHVLALEHLSVEEFQD